MADQIDQVALGPGVEIFMITVGHLRRTPLVERLGHDHDAKFVTKTYQFGRRHIVGRADGVGSHVLQLE